MSERRTYTREEVMVLTALAAREACRRSAEMIERGELTREAMAETSRAIADRIEELVDGPPVDATALGRRADG